MNMLLNKTRLTAKRGDITEENVDAIVNAANSRLCGGGGVDGAIHRAGGPSILEQCQNIYHSQGRCEAGNAIIISAGQLLAKYVIHAVGPVWKGGGNKEAETLAAAYKNSLLLAVSAKIRTLAFPSISTGAYGYPIEQAAAIAVNTCCEFALVHHELSEIRFILFSQKDLDIYLKQLEAAGKKDE